MFYDPAELVESLVACYWFGFLRDRSCRGNLHRLYGDARNGGKNLLHRANLDHRFVGLLKHELFVNAADFGGFLMRLLAADAVFFGRGQRNIVLEFADARSIFGIDAERVFVALQVDFLALGEDVVLAVLLVPLSHGRVLVHVFDDFAPTHAGVVGAEGNFTLLGGVGDDAHFGAAEVVVEKILEPHSSDEQEVPGILVAALHRVFDGASRIDFAVFGC